LRFYYDTANAMTIHPLVSLTKLVAPTQILFGTDFPFLTASATAAGRARSVYLVSPSCKTSSEKMQPKEEFISR
jgi:hypothetical protein